MKLPQSGCNKTMLVGALTHRNLCCLDAINLNRLFYTWLPSHTIVCWYVQFKVGQFSILENKKNFHKLILSQFIDLLVK